jgi:hypothetical protein
MSRKSGAGMSSKTLKKVPARDGGPQIMNRNRRIEHEVEETLRGFETDEAPRPRPEFAARVQARIRNESAAPRTAGARPFGQRVLLHASLALLIALNVITAVSLLHKSSSSAAGKQRILAVNALAEEYDLKPGAESGYWK